MSRLNTATVRRLVKLALEEDLPKGDITTSLSIPATVKASAKIIAREKLVVCGLELAGLVLKELGCRDVKVQLKAKDGDYVKANSELVHLNGSAKAIITAERTILNFLQRMSGVASYTRNFCGVAKSITVLDTRKTTPGWRTLEKYACAVGGAKNHRANLSEMILVKNNHLDITPGKDRAERMSNLLAKLVSQKPPKIPLEVEVRDLVELEAAIRYNPDMILLDNMSDSMIGRSLKILTKRAPGIMVEVSGGVGVKRIPSLRKLGVKFISVGSLSTQATNRDISLRIIKK